MLAWATGGWGKTAGRQRRAFGLRRQHGAQARPVVLGLGLACVLVCALGAGRCHGAHAYPRVGNMFPRDVRAEYAAAFSKWDVVGFTVDVQDRIPGMAGTLRGLNPDIVLLAYFPIGIIWARPDTTNPTIGPFWRKVRDADWWLYDDRGNRLLYRDDYYFLNVTNKCPRDGSGRNLAEWVAEYVADHAMSTGFWDGLILDALGAQISWVNDFPDLFEELPAGVDCDRDGVIDDPDSLDSWWKAGAETCLSTLRGEVGPSALIIPNSNNQFHQYANGGIRENFPIMAGGWDASMFGPHGYITACDSYLDQPMNLSMIWCYWNQEEFDFFNEPTSASFERFARFTLASAMLGDGYYFLDGGYAGSLWWLDYYDLDVGTPLGAAYLDSIESFSDHLEHPVWRRDFTNGTVLCNPYRQYLLLEDNTWLSAEDGLIITTSLPGPVGVSFDKQACDRQFERDRRALTFQVIVANPNPKAAQPHRWAELWNDQRKVASGLPTRVLVGAEGADTLNLGFRIPASLPLGTYCAKVFLSGPSLAPVCVDTMYVTKVLDFEKDGKPIGDDQNTGYIHLEEDGLSIYPQPALVSAQNALRMEVNELTSVGDFCSIKIYDAAGRLVETVFEGTLESGLVLTIGDDEGGVLGVPGVYFLHIETRDKALTQKIVLLK